MNNIFHALISRTLISRRALLTRCTAFFVAGLLAPGLRAQPAGQTFRPPAVPLVAHDPYWSIWSAADTLTGAGTTHWTGKPQRLSSLIRVDGVAYRLMGTEPADIPALPQTGLDVLPTRTIYRFASDRVRVTLTFLTPALPDDLDLISRPVTYLTWDVQSADNKSHSVDLYVDAAAEIAVNTPAQRVTWNRERVPGLTVLRTGSEGQNVLGRSGDDLRIDWGYLYLAAPAQRGLSAAIGSGESARIAFSRSTPGGLGTDDTRKPRPAGEESPALSIAFALGPVGARPVSRHVLLAYDDLFSINYFGERLRPYWRRNGMDAAGLLRKAESDYTRLADRCRAFDDRLLGDLRAAGGDAYARVGALMYRQTLAGNKLAADARGMPLLFPKENNSNGCIATVDAIYPMAPQFLLTSPALGRAMLVPVLDYAASPRWKFPFAPHDLGTYPKATGQVYGGGERTEDNQMPVEESGNLLLLVAAQCRAEKSAAFARQYWPLLETWAAYLRDKGMDPENQLCTDDFAGHLAHNVNLSAKAIVALGAFAGLCEQVGKKEEAELYRRVAHDFAARWVEMASDGDHTRLAFDRPGTWSQKYNLVWDRLLDLNLFRTTFFSVRSPFTGKRRTRTVCRSTTGATTPSWIGSSGPRASPKIAPTSRR